MALLYCVILYILYHFILYMVLRVYDSPVLFITGLPCAIHKSRTESLSEADYRFLFQASLEYLFIL